ncbi:unnamed protein product [Hermetia illucens]|uniref:Cytochrome P450 n=1 Tax=Hermetia illucens TaxID=343691 RepID=A0A7R8UEW4_HERIL|nr:unnamed protein product [Hermetia illucens]
MMFALCELALNPDIQEKARQEIEEVLSKHEGKISYESIKEMVYSDKIISESSRNYPAVVNLVRKCGHDFRVPNSNVILEQIRRVFISAYSIQHDPEIYENPEGLVAFLRFGDGPRNYVGLRFGRMLSRFGLVTLLKNYRFKPYEKSPNSLEYAEDNPILSPKYGIHLLVENM